MINQTVFSIYRNVFVRNPFLFSIHNYLFQFQICSRHRRQCNTFNSIKLFHMKRQNNNRTQT